MLTKFIIGGIITVAIVATTAEIKYPPKPLFLYNPSHSAPVGWYRLHKNVLPSLGMQVAAYAPEWARKLADERRYLPYDYPLIKTVWAIEGAKVCYNNTSVSVPNRPDISVQAQDSLGRDMPLRSGCIVLKSGEYFLVSPDVQMGFDSRYFGPVTIENILGQVEYLENSKNKKIQKILGFGGFEG